ncbi:hypothetical protein PR048_018198 [Dryococelus australis]|uniref:Uncharacterized protein n=1 Tax=Dryococelus australis TaxID=614101 RepID=A0ABQ9HBM0_9NEOP|nr:hypothetical protein PR048_018198 [Dryococelus australis]
MPQHCAGQSGCSVVNVSYRINVIDFYLWGDVDSSYTMRFTSTVAALLHCLQGASGDRSMSYCKQARWEGSTPQYRIDPSSYRRGYTLGKEQQWALGSYLRSRYDGFLPAVYSADDVLVRSSDADRAIISASILMSGLFASAPPTEFVNVYWQSVPVHTLPEDRDPRTTTHVDVLIAGQRLTLDLADRCITTEKAWKRKCTFNYPAPPLPVTTLGACWRTQLANVVAWSFAILASSVDRWPDCYRVRFLN